MFWLQAHTTVIRQAASSPAECLHRITRERSLQLTLSKLCFLLWPNSLSKASTPLQNIKRSIRELFPRLFSSDTLNTSRCSYLAVQLFVLLFTPLRTKHSGVLREESTQICKAKYKSIIIMSHLIKQLSMAGSDQLGEAVANFSCSIGTMKKP